MKEDLCYLYFYFPLVEFENILYIFQPFGLYLLLIIDAHIWDFVLIVFYC